MSIHCFICGHPENWCQGEEFDFDDTVYFCVRCKDYVYFDENWRGESARKVAEQDLTECSKCKGQGFV